MARNASDRKSQLERMLSGDLYDCSDPELFQMRSRAKVLLREYNQELGYSEDLGLRQNHMRKVFGAVGKGCIIEPPFRVDYGTHIEAGDNLYCNFDTVILDW